MPSKPSAFTSIPIIDFAQTLSPATKPAFLAQPREALINVGFFYLQNPPGSPTVRDTFISKGLELFELPLEKKIEIEMVNSPHFLGYSRLGAEITALKSDHREQFDVSLILTSSESHAYHNSLQLKSRLLVLMSRCIEILLGPIRYV